MTSPHPGVPDGSRGLDLRRTLAGIDSPVILTEGHREWSTGEAARARVVLARTSPERPFETTPLPREGGTVPRGRSGWWAVYAAPSDGLVEVRSVRGTRRGAVLWVLFRDGVVDSLTSDPRLAWAASGTRAPFPVSDTRVDARMSSVAELENRMELTPLTGTARDVREARLLRARLLRSGGVHPVYGESAGWLSMTRARLILARDAERKQYGT